SDASVVNLGKISASSSDVILIARTVENHGTIEAPNGTAALAAGSEVLVKADGEERIFVEAGSAEGTSKATQAGLIRAAEAEIKAAGGNEYALAIKHTGVTRATGVSKRGGRIFLSAGGKSTVRHSGTIEAQKSDGNGGQVRVEAARIELAPISKIDVSADPASLVGNGGEVLIGGGYQGQDPSLGNAETVTAEEGSILLADAAAEGDGGRVILWSDDTTRFAGTISARGGAVSGDGGFVETSGSVLSLSGSARVTTSAAHGTFGAWLLDPADMEIVSGDGGDLTGFAVDPGAIVAALDGSNIVLLADNSITVSDVIDASGNVGAGHLTLDAPTLHLNAAILLRGGSVLSGTASTVNVGASGRVQNGIDAAAAGGLVNLLGANYGSTGSELRIGKSLTMRGSVGGTVLDAQGNHGVLRITGDTSATGVVVTLDRLTFTGGDALFGGRGGGIYINGGGGRKTDVTIQDSTISGNSADFGGGNLQ
ncbi:MAG: hypothetical protein GXX91_17640, partial [Verrucomicrobiaceae bacterium]|nr:hypothetical protein [Verrucomicrobiaceae bacterium]